MGIVESLGIGVLFESCLNRIFVKIDNVIFIFYLFVVVVKYQGGFYYVFDFYNKGINGLCDFEGKCVVLMFNCF